VTTTPTERGPADGASTEHRRVRSRRGEGDRLREEILVATRDLLAETGSEDAVSIRAVAHRVGVSTPSIYLHFPDKRALLDAVCEQVFAALDAELEAAASSARTPFEALRLAGMAYVRFGVENPEHYRIVFLVRRAPATHDESLIVASDVFQHFTMRVAACVEAGVLRGDPAALAMTLWSAAHGITSLLVSKPNWPWQDAEALVDSVIRTAGLGLALSSRLDPTLIDADTEPGLAADAIEAAGHDLAAAVRQMPC
jgi:AcrR family transcriptional regulator